MRPRIVGDWPAQGVTFDVRRGSFTIPKTLIEDGDEHEIARLYAQSIPEDASLGRRERLRDGDVRIHWHIIRVVAA